MPCERHPREFASDTEAALNCDGIAVPRLEFAEGRARPTSERVVTGVIANEIPFLAGLDPASSRAIHERMASVAVAGGTTLFEEGEEGDSLYTLIAGAVGISTRDPSNGLVQRIARLRPPETFGEMALLTSAPRSATATALRDTHLLRLARSAFEEVIDLHPRTLRYFARLLAERLRRANSHRPLDAMPGTYAVIAVTEGPSAAAFGHELARSLDAVLPGSTGCLTEWPTGADETWFHAFEADHDRTIYVAREIDCPWCRLCLRHADHVVLLADPEVPPRPGAAEYVARIGSDWVRIDLAIRQDPAVRLPRSLHPALAALPVALRIQIRDGASGDYHRLARLISGTGRGVVLGGGGARGLAHLGVLRALEEAALPVDFVGGTSMGAIIAASVAMGWSSAQIDAHTADFFGRRNPLSDYTLPYIALTRGARVDAGLSAQFGGAKIEDLWLPFFCVSSNLTTGDASIHRHGSLTDALRASIAIPGLLPPVCATEGVLVDGGMMNNLPADVMSTMQRGPVLAVDVGSDLAFQATRAQTWHGRLMRRLLRTPDDMPSIAPVLLRAATVSSDAQTTIAVSRATVVLKPTLAGVDLRAWSSFEATSRLGYLCAQEAIGEDRMRSWINPVS